MGAGVGNGRIGGGAAADLESGGVDGVGDGVNGTGLMSMGFGAGQRMLEAVQGGGEEGVLCTRTRARVCGYVRIAKLTGDRPTKRVSSRFVDPFLQRSNIVLFHGREDLFRDVDRIPLFWGLMGERKEGRGGLTCRDAVLCVEVRLPRNGRRVAVPSAFPVECHRCG